MFNQLLETLGIKSYDQLSEAEKQTYKEWTTILTLPDPNVDDLKKFFAKEQDRADSECRNFENDQRKQLYYQMYASFLVMAQAFLSGPSAQRDALKARLKKDFHIDA
jgi:hypothetical protein